MRNGLIPLYATSRSIRGWSLYAPLTAATFARTASTAPSNFD